MTLRAKISLFSVASLLCLVTMLYLICEWAMQTSSTASPIIRFDLNKKVFVELTDLAGDPDTTESYQALRFTDASGAEIATFDLSASSGSITSIATPNPSAVLVSTVSGRNTIILACIGLLITGFLAAAGLVHQSIIKPMRCLSSLMQKISAAGNLSLRVPTGDAQLLSSLTASVNDILENTENSYFEMLQARYEAESANKGKSLFISKVSHELRTPIHSITGMLRILLKQEQAPGKRQYIQMAKDSADALLSTINEVLDFSKMQSGGLNLESEEFDLAATIRSTIEHLIPRFEEKPEISLCWDMHPGLPEKVIGDHNRVTNILVNLLGNAFKFTEKGHVLLEVSCYEAADTSRAGIRFAVSDSGIGIAKEKLSHIFDPFTTADERSARLYAGTGLGLAIVKQIAEQMGGSVSASSAVGEGSTFVVTIPFEAASTGAMKTSLEPKKVAILCEQGPREWVATEGFTRLGCKSTAFHFDNPGELHLLNECLPAFDIIYIIKNGEILIDELAPVIRAATQNTIPLVLSRPSSELTSSDNLARSDLFFQTLQPTCPLDVLLIASGRLQPNTTIEPHDESEEQAEHKLNILVADDAKTNRIILKNLLEDAGHSVELVENGKQLLEKITYVSDEMARKARPFDLVLTDIQMPVMDGLTATQNFREMERKSSVAKKLPIVAVTSYALPEECSKMLALGIDHIITKPINPRRLSRLISQIGHETDSDDENNSTLESSDQEVLEELCRVTEQVVSRVGEITHEVTGASPMSCPLSVDMLDVYERSGNSLRRTGLILNGFLDSYAQPLQALEATKLPVDPTVFRRTVHSLKGLLLDVGANGPGELASKLEKQAVECPETIAPEEIQALSEAVRSTVLIIKDIVQALPSVELFSALPPIDDALTVH